MKRFLLICSSALLICANLYASETLDKGLWWLYHLQYDRARDSFEAHIRTHPEDPAGYFYLTATHWWHLAQDVEYDLPEVRAKMEEDAQRTIATAKALYDSSTDKKTKARAALYWGGAEGLWGRWLVTQGQWVKAYFAGKRGHKMLSRAVRLDPELYDAYLGLGIYDYYTDTMSGVQKVLAAMLIRGDKVRGLKQLHMAIEKGDKSKVEAMCFLIEIYTSEENTPDKALPYAETLTKMFPQSPAMQLIKVSTLFTMKAWEAMLPEAEEFLQKSLQEKPWFSHKYVQPARYCVGIGKLWGKKDLAGAEEEFNKIIAADDGKSRWVKFAYLRRGQIHDMRGERDKAKADYQEALKGPNLWGLHKEANQYLKTPFTT